MRAYLHGRVDRPAIAVVGVWDPLLPAHEQLIQELTTRARATSRAAVAIAIDPDPVRYLYGASELPVYNDAHTRIGQMLHRGLDAVVRVRFFRRDIDATAADFFSAIDPFARLAELWLGARQSLGRMEGGNTAAIIRAAELRDTRIVRLPYRPIGTRSVRDLLRDGRLIQAAQLVGRPPIRSRPRNGKVVLSWCPGIYGAVPIPDPNSSTEGPCLDLRLTPQVQGLPRLDWPDSSIDYLAFVRGPADPTHGTRGEAAHIGDGEDG